MFSYKSTRISLYLLFIYFLLVPSYITIDILFHVQSVFIFLNFSQYNCILILEAKVGEVLPWAFQLKF